MSRAVDLESALAPLRFLENRGPETAPADEAAAFAKLADYRDGGVFVGGFSGVSPWERHPQGDEFVQVLKGSARLVLRTEQGDELEELRAGSVIVVPRGMWHHFESPEGVTVLTITPQPTEHRRDGGEPG